MHWELKQYWTINMKLMKNEINFFVFRHPENGIFNLNLFQGLFKGILKQVQNDV